MIGGTAVRPASASTSERLYVAVIDADQAVRHGVASLLDTDARLHVMDPVACLHDLSATALQFDACVLDLFGVGSTDEITDLFRDVPSVVCTSAIGWRTWVAAWTCGARGVVSRNVASVSMADAVWDAVHRPYDVQPQLARALTEAIAECSLRPADELTGVLASVASGRRVPSVLTASGISGLAYQSQMKDLRERCQQARLGTLGDPQPERTGPAFEPSVTPPEALALTSRIREVLRYYADGCSYADIADLLCISETTVKTHVLTAMDKYGITSNRSAEVRLLFAQYMSARHRRPEVVKQRLEKLRDG